MLERIYCDNYKSLVNFDLKLASLQLILGDSGSGKSSVFEVLLGLQALISGQGKLIDLFPTSSLTRWQTRPLQRFEFTILLEEKRYSYTLILEHEPKQRKVRIQEERVTMDGQTLFLFENGQVHLFRDDQSAGPVFPFDWTQSGLNIVMERNDNQYLIALKKAVTAWLIVQINPKVMGETSLAEATSLDCQMANFSSWLRYTSLEHQDLYMKLVLALKEIFPEFQSFKFVAVGEDVKSLRVVQGEDLIAYKFSELSDGQRCLIALEALRYCTGNITLCIDEPESYLALPEVQPWLLAIQERCLEQDLQALLISHHPEYINFLAMDCGIWFDREPNGPVRPRYLSQDADSDGLPVAELVARGWLAE